jgi:3-methylcrotonyl-CoA carboxylase alpha subunit
MEEQVSAGRRLVVHAGDASWTVDLIAPGQVAVAGAPSPLTIEEVGPGAYHVSDGQRSWLAWVAGTGETREVFLEGEVYRLQVSPDGDRPARRPATPDAAVAPMPATITQVLVQLGQAVTRGETVLKLDAMKMELLVRAPRDGVVQAIHYQGGDVVPPGVPLVDIG